MMKWFKIKKREGNALLNGQDLGVVSPKVEIVINPDPKPKKFERKLFFPKGNNVSK